MNNEQTNTAANDVANAEAAKPSKRNWKKIALYSGAGVVAVAAVVGTVILGIKKPEAVAAAADAGAAVAL